MSTNQELEKKVERQKLAHQYLLEGLIIAVNRPGPTPYKYRRKWDEFINALTQLRKITFA